MKEERSTKSENNFDQDVEGHIKRFFEHNYDLLRHEGGHALAEGAKQQALEQVLLYWRKLKGIATTVSETEVKLSLPGQVTPKGRPYVIEGVVDIVREGDEVRMYDLKTHEAQEVRNQRDLYCEQLNVYAHIWKGIRRQRLDGTAIIATRLPLRLREALRRRDATAIEEAMRSWDPVIELPYDESDINGTVQSFGKCVDAIEDGEFDPPPPEAIAQPPGTRRVKDHGGNSSIGPVPTMAQINCRNCDGRFTCCSYREYERSQMDGGGQRRRRRDTEELEQGRELDEWIATNLDDEE